MKTSGWKVFFTWALLLSGLVSAQAQRMPQDSWVLSQTWGGSGAGDGQFNNIRGMATGPDGRIYVADNLNHRIQVFEGDGTFVRQWGGFVSPWDVEVSPSGQVYVVENTGYCVQEFEPDGTFVRTWGNNGAGDGQFSVPKGVAVAPDGRVWVSDCGNNRIQIFEADGTFVWKFGSSGSLAGEFSLPRGITIAPNGLVYVADTGNHRVQVFNQDGTYMRSWSCSSCWDIETGSDGLIYVTRMGIIEVYESNGTFMHSWDASGVAVSVGREGSIAGGGDDDYVRYYSRVYRVKTASGEIPLPVVLACEQRPGTPYLDVDYTIIDFDSPTVSVAVAAFEGGTNSLDHYVQVRTLLDGTEANVGTNVPANATNRISWNVAADWQADYVNLKARVMANDGRGLIDIGFITLPAEGPDAALTISASPLTPEDFMPAWHWLLASGDASVNLSTGKVFGVGGGYDGQILAQETSTTDAGRAFLFDRLGVRESSAAERTRARAGSAGVTNQWTPRVTVGPEDRPRAVNEYGFDTGDWGSDAWWVVKE